MKPALVLLLLLAGCATAYKAADALLGIPPTYTTPPTTQQVLQDKAIGVAVGAGKLALGATPYGKLILLGITVALTLMPKTRKP